ncbi:hypothetical protein SAMN05443667_108142 [Flavobacterium gillisiae]|uniref:Uncharacterized protein n=1 Tax=Flavobacterium gillisiae TaxID=150146 RepID=A0A1H4DVZ1_9FLAO|nr:hypothetical protein SAMN05443667_108142 [Flavobacterium gillisiae]
MLGVCLFNRKHKFPDNLRAYFIPFGKPNKTKYIVTQLSKNDYGTTCKMDRNPVWMFFN